VKITEWLAAELETANARGDAKAIAYWQSRIDRQVAAEVRSEATSFCPRQSSRAWKYWMLR